MICWPSYVDKWVDEGVSLLTTSSANEFALQMVSGLRIFFDRFKKDDKCPLPNSNEKITEDDMKNLELIAIKGASNVIIKNSNSK